jgi:hypothetical protein
VPSKSLETNVAKECNSVAYRRFRAPCGSDQLVSSRENPTYLRVASLRLIRRIVTRGKRGKLRTTFYSKLKDA